MDEQIKKLLEQNLELTKEIYAMTKKVKNYITFQKILSVIYFLIIVVPIILGILYLPPLLNNMFNQYKDILGLQGGASNTIEGILKAGTGNIDLKNINANNLPTEVKKLIK